MRQTLQRLLPPLHFGRRVGCAHSRRCFSDATSDPPAPSTPAPALPTWDCVKFEHVVRASQRIKSGIVRTPISRSHWLSEELGCSVFLKHEQQQFTGSFKERGARNALLALSESEARNGVVAASAGNHALALCWHGKELNIPVTVVMPTVAPMAKVDKCRAFLRGTGGQIVIHGANIGESKAHAMEVYASSADRPAGARYINGYDDPEIIAGTGTIGMEIIEQLPECDVVVVPIGGAGLIAGIALAVKTLNPSVRVIGVEPKRCESYSAALEAGHPVAAETLPTLADGLAVPVVGPHAFAVASHWVDEVVSVEERDVAISVLRLCEGEKMIVEGGGATGLAAMLPGGPLDRADLKGKAVCVPLCGGNIDITVLGRVIDRGLAADGRLVRCTVAVSDRPGGIASLSQTLADLGGSVKDIFHERAWLHTAIDEVVVKVVLETRGHEHNAEIEAALRSLYNDVKISEAPHPRPCYNDV